MVVLILMNINTRKPKYELDYEQKKLTGYSTGIKQRFKKSFSVKSDARKRQQITIEHK